jgi:hypothetical protein
MVDSFEFFDDPLRIKRWFDGSNGGLGNVGIREVDIMPLLVEFVSNLHGFV